MALTARPLRLAHATIKKVTEDVESFAFNTAISQMMILTNEFVNSRPRPIAGLRILLTVLSPFAPHLAEELWERLGERFSGFEGRASTQRWPDYDEDLLALDEVEYGVQSTARFAIAFSPERTPPTPTWRMPRRSIRVSVAGKSVLKLIIVRGKLINIVLAK